MQNNKIGEFTGLNDTYIAYYRNVKSHNKLFLMIHNLDDK